MYLKLFLILLWVFLVLVPTLYWSYLWQLKEYRLDRLRSAIKEQGWWLFVPSHFYRPTPTGKVVLISLASLVCSSASLVISPVLWFLTPLWVAFWVVVLAVPTFLYKILLFEKAKAYLKEFPDLKAIGVTGSYGKSSTKELIAEVLAAQYKTAKTPKNNNTFIGICRAILNLKKSTQFFIVEMGAYKREEIRKICQLVRPGIGVITGLCPQHLALFGSMENLVTAKLELAEAVGKKGTMFLNKDDKLLQKASPRVKSKIIWYGKRESYSLANLAGAAAVGEYFEVPGNSIAKVLENVPFGICTKSSRSGLEILDDSYSSNPIGFSYALDVLVASRRKHKIVITPGIIELGRESVAIHKKLGRKAQKSADLVIVTKREFAGDLGGELITSPKVILQRLKEYPAKDTTILLEGRLNKWLIQSLHN